MVAPNNVLNDNHQLSHFEQDTQESTEGLRTLKNELIGHPQRKQLAIQSGLVTRLGNVLQNNVYQEDTRIQAAIILASLCQVEIPTSACGNDTKRLPFGQLENRPIFEILLRCIGDPAITPALIIPCLRAVNALALAGEDLSILWSNYVDPLTQILHNAAAPTSVKTFVIQQATYVATLFSFVTEDSSPGTQQAEIVLAALIGIAINFTQLGTRIFDQPTPAAKLLEATFSALATMTRLNANFSTQLAVAGRLSPFRCASDDCPMVTTLLRLVRNSNNIIRLYSASCLTNLLRYGTVSRKLYPEIALSVLPILVRLFDDTDLQSQATYVLVDLVRDNTEMQRAACDAGAIKKLSGILQHREDLKDEKVVESALLALAAITLDRDEYRKQVINAKVVPLIVASMSNPSSRIRIAACQCARSLSRSVATLRTSLIDTGVATAVFELMSDPHLGVRTCATAAVCNLVLDFSPMRRLVLDSGALALLTKLTRDLNLELRLNAVWAIKHIVCSADTDVKQAVINELTPSLLLYLCDDPEITIQEQACEVIRNLVCGNPDNIDLVIETIGIERLADFLLRKLLAEAPEIVRSAIYSLVHIAAGSERHRMVLMQRALILEALRGHLGSHTEEIRLGAVWTIINLTWQEDETTASERRARINALESLGFKQKLRELEADISMDVRERAKTALAQMQ